jgi:electron transfer flavoprotein alpha/beta subunit
LQARGGGGGDIAVVASGKKEKNTLCLALGVREGVVVDENTKNPSAHVCSEGGGGVSGC